MDGLVKNCVFLKDPVYGLFGEERGTVYSWKTQCMDGLVGNCVFLEDPVYGWFGGELCISKGSSVWMVWLGTVYSWRT